MNDTYALWSLDIARSYMRVWIHGLFTISKNTLELWEFLHITHFLALYSWFDQNPYCTSTWAIAPHLLASPTKKENNKERSKHNGPLTMVELAFLVPKSKIRTNKLIWCHLKEKDNAFIRVAMCASIHTAQPTYCITFRHIEKSQGEIKKKFICDARILY